MIQSIKASVLACIVDKYLESIALRGNTLCEVYVLVTSALRTVSYVHTSSIHFPSKLLLNEHYAECRIYNMKKSCDLVLRFEDLKALDKME